LMCVVELFFEEVHGAIIRYGSERDNRSRQGFTMYRRW
jgi:hypothetical protein